jgi:hypothetical protein
MQVLINGVVRERKVHSYAQWNGYVGLAIPVLHWGEDIHWTAGSRIPEITGGF